MKNDRLYSGNCGAMQYGGFMNKLSDLFTTISDGATVVLEKDTVYHVRPEDSYSLTGYYCSNTASRDENPNGARSAAIFLKNKKNITIDFF